jgi:Domain of unknown function (DUF4268)
LNYVVRERESQVELYIDLGPNSEAKNLELLNALKSHQVSIEQAFAGELEWQDLPDSRAELSPNFGDGRAGQAAAVLG